MKNKIFFPLFISSKWRYEDVRFSALDNSIESSLQKFDTKVVKESITERTSDGTAYRGFSRLRWTEEWYIWNRSECVSYFCPSQWRPTRAADFPRYIRYECTEIAPRRRVMRERWLVQATRFVFIAPTLAVVREWLFASRMNESLDQASRDIAIFARKRAIKARLSLNLRRIVFLSQKGFEIHRRELCEKEF